MCEVSISIVQGTNSHFNIHSKQIVTLRTEATRSSETSEQTFTTRREPPKKTNKSHTIFCKVHSSCLVCHTWWTVLDKWQHAEAWDTCPTPQCVNTDRVIMNGEEHQPLSRLSSCNSAACPTQLSFGPSHLLTAMCLLTA